MRTSIQQLGAWENSADLTAPVLNQYLNDALVEFYDIALKCRDDWYMKIAPPFTLVANTDTYSLSTITNAVDDFYELRKVEISIDSTQTRWRRLRPIPIDGAHRGSIWGYNATYGNRYRYRLSALGLTFDPMPQVSTDIVRVCYNPTAPQLAADGDTVTFDRPVEQKLVLAIAMRDCYQRQDLPTGTQDALIAKYSTMLRTVADSHDAGEPIYLSRRGPSNYDDDDGGY